MKIEQFSRVYNLVDLGEIEKVEMIAFFLAESKGELEFSVSDISEILFALGFAKPNPTRLKGNISKSRFFVKGISKNTYKISAKRSKELKEILPDISESEEVISDDSIIPEIILVETKRKYLVRLVQQINSAYENNLFDACALMMRRLLEVLLIHAFEHVGIEDDIKDADGNYQNLKTLINKAKSRAEISISNDVAKDMDQFRELGNLSAHRVKYNCRKDDIRKTSLQYRALVEELLYVANLIKVNS